MFCSRAEHSGQAQEPRLQFCRRQVFHRKHKLRLQFYQGLNRYCSFPLLFAPHSPFSIRIDLKRSEKILGATTWRWGELIWLIGPSGLHRNSPEWLNITIGLNDPKCWEKLRLNSKRYDARKKKKKNTKKKNTKKKKKKKKTKAKKTKKKTTAKKTKDSIKILVT